MGRSGSAAGGLIGGLAIGLVVGMLVGAFVLPGLLSPQVPTTCTLTIIRYETGPSEKLTWVPANPGTSTGTTLKNVTIEFQIGMLVLLNVTNGDVDYWQGTDASDVKTVSGMKLFYIVMDGSKTIQPHWL
ncbi:MAG: hypothetical protein JW839_19300 [Candidatus Lokiarchaeota archaeon]|nr:hypothetical protein [Candidatus Lokiarchaeota archaeon]